MPKITNNRDMFAERGDPWEDDSSLSRARTPRLSPDGLLKLNRRAHIHHILAIISPISPISSHAPVAPISRDEDPEMDRHFAEKARPISLRLAKERNRIVPQGEQPHLWSKGSSSSLISKARITGRAKITAKRAQHLIKVK